MENDCSVFSSHTDIYEAYQSFLCLKKHKTKIVYNAQNTSRKLVFSETTSHPGKQPSRELLIHIFFPLFRYILNHNVSKKISMHIKSAILFL